MIRRFFVLLALWACLLPAHGADKYTDENRPYEFGFNIEGEQHRQEKKDEKGIIMGEFGFITADGVYHVTAYATDENGNFKILSMKNIRVKPYPTAGAERQGHSLPLPPSLPQPNLPASVSARQPVPANPSQTKPDIQKPEKSCSHCSLPTTKAPATAIQQNPNYNSPAQNYPQQGGPQYNQQGGAQIIQQNSGNPQNNQEIDTRSGSPSFSEQRGSQKGQSQFGAPFEQQGPGQRNPKRFEPNSPQQQVSGQQDVASRFGSNQPTKPVLISAQMQIVDKNTDIYYRNPGEQEGLPNGITKNEINTLLYTFNYTVGFHGHHEEGYTNGAKIGYYFVTGRNGVRTRVDYEADENGFRPKITQEVLDLVSEDVPKEETEQDEKYGLKGYEFKWLYFPEKLRSR